MAQLIEWITIDLMLLFFKSVLDFSNIICTTSFIVALEMTPVTCEKNL